MEIDRIDPSLREIALRTPRPRLDQWITRSTLSRLSRFTPGSVVAGVERRVERADRLRVYLPRTRRGGALVWAHAGGLVLGTAAQDDRFCAEVANLASAVVVSADYRLAPRTRFPGQLDDLADTFAWVHSHAAELAVDVDRIAIGGRSAGGGLGACLAQRLHDEGVSVRAQWLFCPMLDDRTALDGTLDAEDHFAWNNRMNRAAWRAYLGSQLGASEIAPYAAAARRRDLTGLAPTWLYGSTTELFFAEISAYAAQLTAAGVDTTFEKVHGAPHSFEALEPDAPLSRNLITRAATWLAGRLES